MFLKPKFFSTNHFDVVGGAVVRSTEVVGVEAVDEAYIDKDSVFIRYEDYVERNIQTGFAKKNMRSMKLALEAIPSLKVSRFQFHLRTKAADFLWEVGPSQELFNYLFSELSVIQLKDEELLLTDSRRKIKSELEKLDSLRLGFENVFIDKICKTALIHEREFQR